MKKLWKFEWKLHYGLCIGLFKATDEEIQSVIGRTIYLGDIAGKHSEVFGDIEENEITLISDDPTVVAAIPEMGINPLKCIEEEWEEEE